MKLFKRISATILAVVLLLGSIPVAGSDLMSLFYSTAFAASENGEEKTDFPLNFNDFVYEDFIYSYVNSSEIIIRKYMGNEKNITVPAFIEGLPVTELDSRSFCTAIITENNNIGYENADCEFIETVVLPDSIRKINFEAFAYCKNLRSINMPKDLETLDHRVFTGCVSLQELDFSNGVSYIGVAAFKGTSIKELVITSDTKDFSSGAYFIGGSEIENLIIKTPNVEFCNNAFASSSLKNLTVEGKLNVFDDNVLGEIGTAVLPDTIILPKNSKVDVYYVLEDLYDYMSKDSNENMITFTKSDFTPEILTDGDYEYYINRKGNAIITGFTGVGTKWEDYYGNTVEVTVPEKLGGAPVTIIGCGAFDGRRVRTVTLPDTVTHIQSKAFAGCMYLEKIDLSPNIKTIGSYAFYDAAFTDIYIPESVTVIEMLTFGECQDLKKIDAKGVVEVRYGAFVNGFDLVDFEFSEDFYYVGEEAFRGCNFESFEYDKYITHFGEGAFFSTGLNRFEFNDELTEIPASAFSSSDLTYVVLPPRLEKIGDEAFEYCRNLESVEFSESVESIGQEAFKGCENLKEVKIPDSVTTIEESAFERCKSLTKVKMSSDVRVISAKAFMDCTSLSDFIWEADSKFVFDKVFYNCKALKNFDFTGVELVYLNSFTGSGVTAVTLGHNKNDEATDLSTIETQSFMGCENLDTVAIGGNVTTIKSEAFASCSSLETAVISDSVINIATNAFDNCDSLTIYCEEDSYAHKYAVKNNIPVSTFVVAPIPNQTYTGSAIEPEIDVSVSGEKVMENADFTVKYSDNINVGTAKVTVSGKGIYKVLSSIANFTIITKSIAPVTFAEISEQDYTGEAVIPTLTVTDGNKVLKEGIDYTVTFKNNVNEGTATATIQGIGNYHGTASVNFEITELSVSRKIINTITDFFTSFFAKILAFFNSVFG